MTNSGLSLVTGANGHLGNNLARFLQAQGVQVRASVRNAKIKEPFEGLDCEVVESDITNKSSLAKALQGVETFYAVGAAFKLWAKNPVKEIYHVNMNGARHLVDAAADAGVKRIVYVSSIAALNYATLPTKESNGYNPDRRDWYYNSKNDGERLAFDLAKQRGIELVAVLPSAMIGGKAFGALSVSYNILKLILNKEVPIETNIALNWIDVKDAANGCYLAATKGNNGERYILANERSMSICETTEVARELFPELNLTLPLVLPKPMLYALAGAMEIGGKLRGEAPLLAVKDVAMFSGLRQDFDITKSRAELGFAPKPAKDAVIDAMRYLQQHARRFSISSFL